MTVSPPPSLQTRFTDTPAMRWLFASLLTGVTALCAPLSLHVPGTPIPFTFGPFAVLLSGLLLGSTWGPVAMAQYLLLGWMGYPVFADGKSGFGVMFGLTGGYLWSYPLAAFVVGWLAERGNRAASLSWLILAAAAGLAIIYSLGVGWYATVSRQSLNLAFWQGALIFLGWDTLKALAAVLIAHGRRRR
jgi:biotin transport system substrate-specific component